MLWLDPAMGTYTVDSEKEYGVECNDVTLDRLWASLDWFAFGHYWGWGMKALIIRHYGILWSVSIMWELTEMVFGHLLPNFYECWWDNLVLDVLLCNGLGIFTGMQVLYYSHERIVVQPCAGVQVPDHAGVQVGVGQEPVHHRWQVQESTHAGEVQ